MNRFIRRVALPLAAATAVPALALVAAQSPAQALTYDHLNKIQKRILSGGTALALSGEMDAARTAARAAAPAYSRRGPSCPTGRGDNRKVNQECLTLTDPDLVGRGQAQNETSIAQNPQAPRQLVSSDNDYRRGDGNCYTAYSGDGGASWKDSTVPMGFTRGDDFGGFAREYWQAGGDTSVAWDSRGNAYLSCQVFKRGTSVTEDPDQSSAFYVFRSTGNGGASWNFPGRPVVTNNDVAGAGAVLLDKQLMTIDNSVTSRYRDRIYVTWTLFDADGTAYIYEANSADYGETFSAPVLVSADSSLCPNNFGVAAPHGNCNENQFSQPFVGPDGALYVTYANFNNGVGKPVGDPDAGGDDNGGDDARAAATPNPLENYNQMLLVKSTDGGQTFSAPVLVGQYYDLPDCATYQNGQDEGRACVPETGPTANSFFRATNYPVGSVDPRTGAVAVTYGSYLNQNSNESNGCAPNGFSDLGLDLYTGVKQAGACNNDIVVSASTDGGKTFTGGTVNPRQLPGVRGGAGAKADQFWQWAQYTSNGTLAVAYRDRGYSTDQVTGFTDTSLSGSRNLTAFASQRASNASSPPPTAFSGLFMGDYEGLSALTAGQAHPIWTDTRDPALFLCPGTGVTGTPPATCTSNVPNADVANDENIYTTTLSVPTP